MAEGIYADGEWISWDEINGQLYESQLASEFPEADIELVKIFTDLVDLAREYHDYSDRYLQIWGELGELYAELKHSIQRHAPHTPGSDGRVGNDWVEIKTISPEKGDDKVQVKLSGNFNKLLVVKIDKEFAFSSKMVDRDALVKTTDKVATHSWESGDKGA